MRFFRRSGSSIVVRDGNGMARFITGPTPAEDDSPGEPGGILAYDTEDPEQEAFAKQYEDAPGWYEVDADGNALPPEEPKAEDEPDGGPEKVPENVPVNAGAAPEKEPAHIDEPASAGQGEGL